MSPERAVPQAVTAPCPQCREETVHEVLHGRMGTKGGYTLEATVRCEECGRVHPTTLREAPDVDVAVIVSTGPTSRRTRIALPADDVLRIGDELIVDASTVLVTGIERKDGLRRERAEAKDVGTLWVKDFEATRVRVGINLRNKTISKEIRADPDREFAVGQELMFGRLRVTVHGIKTKERMLRRGSALARDVVRVFAKPTRGETLREEPPPSEEDIAAGRAPSEERTAETVEGDEDAWDEFFEAEEE